MEEKPDAKKPGLRKPTPPYGEAKVSTGHAQTGCQLTVPGTHRQAPRETLAQNELDTYHKEITERTVVICRRGFLQPIAAFLISHWRCRTVLFLKKQHHYNRLLLATVVPSHAHTPTAQDLYAHAGSQPSLRSKFRCTCSVRTWPAIQSVRASCHFKPARDTPFAKILTRSPHIRPPRPSPPRSLHAPLKGGALL